MLPSLEKRCYWERHDVTRHWYHDEQGGTWIRHLPQQVAHGKQCGKEKHLNVNQITVT